MPISLKNKKNWEAQINAKVWKDPKYRRLLVDDPKAALRDMGIAVPHNMNVRIVEDDQTTVTFVIAHSPENATEMSEAELKRFAAGQ